MDRLISLRIPAGWYVKKNQILDIEPFEWKNLEKAEKQFCDYYDDEMFIAVHRATGIQIEAGWSKWNDPEGCYILLLLEPLGEMKPDLDFISELEYDWENPKFEKDFRSTKDLGVEINKIMKEISGGLYHK